MARRLRTRSAGAAERRRESLMRLDSIELNVDFSQCTHDEFGEFLRQLREAIADGRITCEPWKGDTLYCRSSWE